MKVKFQADEDLKIQIISAVKRLESLIDFQTAAEANLYKLSDLEVLEKAKEAGRILVSHDRKTMPFHFGNFIQSNSSAGLIIIGQNKNLKEVAEDIVLIWMDARPEEFMNRILTLPF